jgi:hypothetical protein
LVHSKLGFEFKPRPIRIKAKNLARDAAPGLPDFSCYSLPKRVKYTIYLKIYQQAVKYARWPQNRPNGHAIYQHLPSQNPPKFNQIGLFGLKTNHLATQRGAMEMRRRRQKGGEGRVTVNHRFKGFFLSPCSNKTIRSYRWICITSQVLFALQRKYIGSMVITYF